MREWPMVSLEGVQNPNPRCVVPRDDEANRVGAPVLREAQALTARISQIATVGECLLIGPP